MCIRDRDKIEIRLLNSGQVVSFDGDSFVELTAGDSIRIACSRLETVMVKLKQEMCIRDRPVQARPSVIS